MVLNLGVIRPLCGLISLTLVGSVHILKLYKFDPGWIRPLVNRVDPWWDLSTLWSYKFDPGLVRPLVNRVDPWWDSSTL